jgi:S-adenosylmethionine-diacylglycerol 3-amino-3-carboxypropyl transferase
MPARNRAVRSVLGMAPLGILRPGYSTVREDERIVDEGLRPRPGDRALAITSGGCISLKLLLADVAEVVSIDLSPYQTALLQLKAAAVQSLSHDELWEFIGLAPSSRRASLYQRVRVALPPDAARYWDDRPGEISAGVTRSGRNDRLLHWIGQAVTAIQGRGRVDRLLTCTALHEQRAFVDGEWNTRRWRALLSTLLDRRVLARVIDSELSDPASSIRAELDHVLRDVPAADNFYLFYILRGTYPSSDMCPAWLRATDHARLAERVARLTSITESLETYLRSPAAGTFDAFYLSNIFDWMTHADEDNALQQIIGAARPGARLCYWTNLINRPREHSDRFTALRYDRAISTGIMASHRAPGYSACVVATIEPAAGAARQRR